MLTAFFKMIIFNKIVLFSIIYQTLGQSIDSPCTLKSTGSPGKCKLISECEQIRDEVIRDQKLPQVCGFRETQSIVCCPLSGKRVIGEISKEKCREYASYAYKDPSGATVNKCGHTIVKRIIGGYKVSRKEFAHMALIGFKRGTEEIRWICGGTLISEQYILTNANCKGSLSVGEAKFVKLGITDINDDDKKQEFKIAEFIVHPDYHPPVVYNDIGLIRLEKPVSLHSHARPACLYTKHAISSEKGIATGWGVTSFGGGSSDHLLKVSLKLVTNEFCNTRYNDTSNKRLPRGIDEATQICAGDGVEQKDTCQGDSGGPLQMYHTGDDVECMYDIIGITSFGKGCFGGPGVYTRVAHYVKWIEDIVWPQSS